MNTNNKTNDEIEKAKRIAGLWRAGKIIGYDEQDVSITLLTYIEELEKQLKEKVRPS